MNKYIYQSIVHTLSVIAIGVIMIVAINAIWQGALSSATFFNAIGSLFTGLIK